MPWSWHCFDAATSEPLGTVDMASWSHEDRLNDSGQWSATMAAPETAPIARAALAATLEARSVIVAMRTNSHGIPDAVYTGYIPPGGRRVPDLAGANLLSYLDLRHLGESVTYTAVDQHTLIADLITRTQSTGHGIDIDVSQAGTSGELRDQTWNSWERKNIGEAIRQKQAIIRGPDFDIRTEIDSGALVRRLRCWTPRRGRIYVEHVTPEFIHGGNASIAAPAAGLETFVTETTALGEEIDEVTRERRSESDTADDLIALGWPIINHTLNLPDIITDAVLLEHAEGHIDRHAVEAADEIVLNVNPNDPTWPWGSYELGDDCRIKIPEGADPWWPDGFNQIRRIVGHRWTVDAKGELLQVITGRPLEA